MDIYPHFVYFSGHEASNRLNIALVDIPTDQQLDIVRALTHPTSQQGYVIDGPCVCVYTNLHRYLLPVVDLFPVRENVEMGVVFVGEHQGVFTQQDENVYVAFFALQNSKKHVQ